MAIQADNEIRELTPNRVANSWTTRPSSTWE